MTTGPPVEFDLQWSRIVNAGHVDTQGIVLTIFPVNDQGSLQRSQGSGRDNIAGIDIFDHHIGPVDLQGVIIGITINGQIDFGCGVDHMDHNIVAVPSHVGDISTQPTAQEVCNFKSFRKPRECTCNRVDSIVLNQSKLVTVNGIIAVDQVQSGATEINGPTHYKLIKTRSGGCAIDFDVECVIGI
ncbi:hypothetical protein Enr10x_14160 [Gimesia panareensis]|uniref:Uncharacterized protein n=1 Tax=Gimesia panareensis TaxID=2527978 RepID=A0A517Q3B0_9PLAN|nr:hypothetical protein Enr10x_14160 [Gimesia panareensis]